MKRNTLLIIGLLIASIISTQVFAHIIPTYEDRIKDTAQLIKKIKAVPEYSMFVKAFEKTDLQERLALLDEYTLLVPNNKAFKKLPEDVYENFLKEEHHADLEKVLSYLIIPKKIDEKDLNNYKTLNTIAGEKLNILSNEFTTIENARLIEIKINRRNSIVYTINELILPL